MIFLFVLPVNMMVGYVMLALCLDLFALVMLFVWCYVRKDVLFPL